MTVWRCEKRPPEYYAVQWLGHNLEEVQTIFPSARSDRRPGRLYVPDDRVHGCPIGRWLVKGQDGTTRTLNSESYRREFRELGLDLEHGGVDPCDP